MTYQRFTGAYSHISLKMEGCQQKKLQSLLLILLSKFCNTRKQLLMIYQRFTGAYSHISLKMGGYQQKKLQGLLLILLVFYLGLF